MTPDSWDAARAAAALGDVFLLVEWALRRGIANTAARRNVLELSRQLAVQHCKDHDPILFEAVESVNQLIARWKSPGPSPGDDWYDEETP
jgi:hypothetical protein